MLTLLGVAGFLGGPTLGAQELERAFCDPNDPDNSCPGEDCVCVDDSLEMVFEGQMEDSVFEYNNFDPDLIIRGRVVLDVKSDQVRGYSFGVAHDTEVINPIVGPRGINIDGGPTMEDPPTASLPATMGGFVANRLIVVDGVRQGFILAIVLNFSEPVVLPVERATLVNCNYQLERDAGAEGTVLSFDETLGEPPTQIVLTVDKLEFPDMVNGPEGNCVDGEDNDFDGLVDRDDPDCVLRNGVSRLPQQVVDGIVRPVAGPPPPPPPPPAAATTASSASAGLRGLGFRFRRYVGRGRAAAGAGRRFLDRHG